MDEKRKLQIQEDNDLFRSEMDEELGTILLGQNVHQSPQKKDIIYHVMDYSFGDDLEDNDHRYGVFELNHKSFYFQIDYLDLNLLDPKNPYENDDFIRVLSINQLGPL
jgi:hypothetical protein